MAAAETRRLLEQLMGEQLMSGTDQRAPQLPITDPKVCRSYLVGNCPHDLFTNTKNELGPCPKVHNEALKAEYADASDDQKRRWGFDFDYMRDMQHHIDSCNRKIESAQRRLEKTPEEIRQTNALLKAIHELEKSIEAGMLEIKIMGEEGMVNMAVQEFTKIRYKKAEKEERERELRALSDTGGPSGHQKLQVCDVCGAYLSRLDNDRRLADHFYGKMHLGYAQMRKSYDALTKELKDRPQPGRNSYTPSATSQPQIFSLALDHTTDGNSSPGGQLAIGGIPNVQHDGNWVTVPIQPIAKNVYAYYAINIDGFDITSPISSP
ncbi:U1 snRNP-associated protein [Pyrenophora tritici-repentis]|uniref:LUC7, U1 snRNP component, mediates U1 snRNP association with cap-binding complex n=1 Tax=Pyrenophora tritici-repentis TaxID=45151 RepID=A0A5M9KTW1_9PLEO|nr:U1 snRNP-associated protein [Pyrenophora tritici-repentis]KAF7565697.1 LUC7, U1 snRNP component, mediates U1 snRNP association with cap-binding complex [Pyrenophora tritici-repentis]KAI0581668.1 U1 snRNP-associated protein Usp106 [Pyrenophora tritici-repentis]KAI1531500.1 LUC7 U1 snRNP component mediates U1 snRNP association with cap-binding complex [Pyrenophora tritici-repentis]KAI1540000.1 LUC7 U1 snRNP component mediates U1 snRNP association with cap-binding complex [Pyrenophora tritici-r